MLVHSPRARAYLELVRLPNLFTAVGDIVAGYLIVSRGVDVSWRDLVILTLASVCLYAGGVVLNDYFDRDVDAVERPERPIPSGRVAARDALKLGVRLLCLGCVFAFVVGIPSLLVAVLLAGCIWLYDAKGKRIEYVGSLNMGACRFLNVVLGASGAAPLHAETWLWLVLPGGTDRVSVHLGGDAAGDRRGLGRQSNRLQPGVRGDCRRHWGSHLARHRRPAGDAAVLVPVPGRVRGGHAWRGRPGGPLADGATHPHGDQNLRPRP